MNTDEINQVALAGSRTLKLKQRDGKPIDVVLRLIKISEIPIFLDIVEQEIESLVFCIQSPQKLDFDLLSDESYDELVEANYELNFTRALASQKRKLARAERIGVGLGEMAKDMVLLLSKYAPKLQSTDSDAVDPKRSET